MYATECLICKRLIYDPDEAFISNKCWDNYTAVCGVCAAKVKMFHDFLNKDHPLTFRTVSIDEILDEVTKRR